MMGSTLLQESWALEVGSREPWAEDSKLIQPLEETQAQCNEKAYSLAIQCYLRICGLAHVVEQRPNAEFISPTGTATVLLCGSFILAELDAIVAFVASKGICRTTDLTAAEKGDLLAYFSMVQTVLNDAELYYSWVLPEGYEVTWKRYGSVYAWPLNILMPWKKRRAVIRSMKDWASKSKKDVLDEVNTCLSALSDRLSNRECFFLSKPNELDALVFGHLFVLLNDTKSALGNEVGALISKHHNLVNFCDRINKEYFEGTLS